MVSLRSPDLSAFPESPYAAALRDGRRGLRFEGALEEEYLRARLWDSRTLIRAACTLGVMLGGQRVVERIVSSDWHQPVFFTLAFVFLTTVALAAFACTDCSSMKPRLLEFCDQVVKKGEPCAQYQLVRDRLCRRTCLGVLRMDCRDAYQVCQEDFDCPVLCVKFFEELCPKLDVPEKKDKGKKLNTVGVAPGPAMPVLSDAKLRALGITQLKGPLMVSQKYKEMETLGLVKLLPYTITKDITLRDIARRFGSSPYLIMDANPRKVPVGDYLFFDNLIVVPVPILKKKDVCPGFPLD